MNDPTTPVWEAIGGLSRFAALAAFAELRAADHLAEPLAPAELARRCGADGPSLARILRELAGSGIVRTLPDGRYALTPAGRTLRGDAPDSMLAAVLMNAGPELRHAYANLPRTVRAGRSAFAEDHGPLYEYLAARPDRSRLFDDYMTARAVPHRRAAVALYDFSKVESLVDVGGGRGHFLATVLDAHPHVRGTLFELPHVAAGAALPHPVEIVPGDFFTDPLPSGRDAYLLASVLHNWSDEDALRILRNVRRALPPHGRVLVLEYALPEDDRPHVGLDGDVRMLALFDGGAERTRGEYAALLAKAGLTLTRALPLPAGTTLMEARGNS